MTEAPELLQLLMRLRTALEVPTKLSKKDHKEARAAALHLGNFCWLCVGWSAAQPNTKHEAEAPTRRGVVGLIGLLEANASNKRRGRPPTEGTHFIDSIIWWQYTFENPGNKSLARFINAAVKAGSLDDKSTEAHEKRIRRLKKSWDEIRD